MSKSHIIHVYQLVLATEPAAVLSAAERCDGHGILSPDAFTDAGLPVEVVAHLTRTYRSDGSPKGTIFVNDEPVKELSGVYGLDMLRFLATALDVKYARAMGRGFEARNIQAALRAHFNKAPTPPKAA